MTTILLSAGDASGDAHAADLVRALRRRHADWRFVGLGGAALSQAGAELDADARALAVGGLFELAGGVAGVLRSWRAMGRALRTRAPDLVVLVDSGGFNLPFARRVKRSGDVPVLYFVAPQVWAWRAGRARKLAARSDRIAVLLPFEQRFLAERGIDSVCVGHPILDRPVAAPRPPDAQRRARERLALDAEAPILLLMPGSRRNEVRGNLPLQLAALERLREQHPRLAGLGALVLRAPSIDAAWLRTLLATASARPTPGGAVEIVEHGLDPLDAADVALCKPGSGTLELMLRTRPMVVTARAHPLTAAIVRRRLRVPFLAMPNLLAGREIVPERLQDQATPDRIAGAAAPLFPERRSADGETGSSAREAQLAALAQTRLQLGEPGAVERVADLVEEMLGTDRT